MTRKDYEAIAKVLAGELEYLAGLPQATQADRDVVAGATQTVRTLAHRLATEFEANSRFDRDRFITACGLT